MLHAERHANVWPLEFANGFIGGGILGVSVTAPSAWMP